jgi:hypothetical protein
MRIEKGNLSSCPNIDEKDESGDRVEQLKLSQKNIKGKYSDVSVYFLWHN